MIRSSFSIKDGHWKISWPGRISQHDVVCLSPPLDPIQGLPLGNGDLGALVWCEPQHIQIAVNKCDLWDDTGIDAEEIHKHAPYYNEDVTVLRHACRVTIDLGLPLMDTWYLKDFEARIDLAKATVTIRSETPFGTMSARIFISAATKSLVAQVQVKARENWSPSIVMNRWGSRNFHAWNNQRERDPSRGLGGTCIRIVDSDVVLTQQLRKLHFAVAASAYDSARGIKPVVLHSRSASWICKPAEHHELDFFLSVANSEEVSDTEKVSRGQISGIRCKGVESVKSQHESEWERFWKDIHLKFGDPCLEQLWHLTLYYAGSSQRGRYPAPFNQALWGWNRDFQPWYVYHHWNQMQLIFPVAAAGHPELMKPYLDYQFSALDGARQAARTEGRPGAHYSDVCDRNGLMRPEHNRTPGGQTVQYFWDYYRYTGDVAYLMDKGWPVMVETARFYYSILEKKDDGFYHSSPASAYEGSALLRDCITELVSVRRVFEIVLVVEKLRKENSGQKTEDGRLAGVEVSEEELRQWRDVLEHLVPCATIESPNNPGVTVFAAGWQKRVEKDADKVICGGFSEGEPEEWVDPVLTTALDPKHWGVIFSDVETSPVFPDGRIGLGQKGTRDFELAINTVKEGATHWLGPVVMARLGMREGLPRAIANLSTSKRFAWNSSGFFHDGVDFWRTAMIADPQKAPEDWLTADVNGPKWDEFTKSRIPTRMWEFRRIGQERTYVLATAVNESLLQSHDEVIRIAPALPLDWPFAFTLLAVGGFLVSSEGAGEKVYWVHIESTRGGRCTVANPWKSPIFLLDVSTGKNSWLEGGNVAFDTVEGKRYMLTPERITFGDWQCVPVEAGPNCGPKSNGSNMALGIPKMY